MLYLNDLMKINILRIIKKIVENFQYFHTKSHFYIGFALPKSSAVLNYKEKSTKKIL